MGLFSWKHSEEENGTHPQFLWKEKGKGYT